MSGTTHDNINQYINKHLDRWKYAYYNFMGRCLEQYPPAPKSVKSVGLALIFMQKIELLRTNDLTRFIVTGH